MTISKFNKLENEEQITEVWKHGKIVSSRIEGFYKYLLLQIYSFYVELRYDSRMQVLDFESHTITSHRLEEYLERININYLLPEADYE